MGRRISYQTKLYFSKKFYEACCHLWFVQDKVHNDLKLDNILISDCFSMLLLCDLGHADDYNMNLERVVGTPEYRAPEINELAGSFSAAKAEVFAFASVLFVLFFEKLPFSKMATSNNHLYQLVMAGE